MTIPSLSIAERGDSLYIFITAFISATVNNKFHCIKTTISVCAVRSLSRFPQ